MYRYMVPPRRVQTFSFSRNGEPRLFVTTTTPSHEKTIVKVRDRSLFNNLILINQQLRNKEKVEEHSYGAKKRFDGLK